MPLLCGSGAGDVLFSESYMLCRTDVYILRFEQFWFHILYKGEICLDATTTPIYPTVICLRVYKVAQSVPPIVRGYRRPQGCACGSNQFPKSENSVYVAKLERVRNHLDELKLGVLGKAKTSHEHFKLRVLSLGVTDPLNCLTTRKIVTTISTALYP